MKIIKKSKEFEDASEYNKQTQRMVLGGSSSEN